MSVVLAMMRLQAPKYGLELTYHAGQVVNDFYLPDIIFGLPKSSFNIC